MLNNKYLNNTLVLAFTFSISACSTIVDPNQPIETNKVDVSKSYLEANQSIESDNAENKSEPDEVIEAGGLKRINTLSDSQKGLTLEIDLADRFNNNQRFQVSVNALPLNDFIHYTFGELLNVSYLIEPSVKNNLTPVTLELKEEISSKKLFTLVRQILSRSNVNIVLNDDIFYVHPVDLKNNKSNKAFGFGRNKSSVPNVSGEIIQLVPMHYNISGSIRNTIRNLVDARVDVDVNQGLITISGQRESVLRALSLVNILDSATVHRKSVGLITLNYMDSITFIDKLTLLLDQEGIKVGSKFNGKGSVNFVPLEHLGQMVVFASADEVLDRVEYWLEELDLPATGAEQSFYIYHPKYARATDLGQSLAPLIGGSFSSTAMRNSEGVQQSRQNNQQSATAAPKNNTAGASVKSIEGENMRLVVDERANALIFYASGQHYQELQPIIRQLDIMPKQVMLEVVIAEVKLTGSFAKGVEFAVSSGASSSASSNEIKSFSFNGESGFNYSVVGIDGNVNINLNQTDGLINVLSRPTLLVRDGVSANISVGDDIPTIGSTTTDPIVGERQTTTIQYRKTGVNLSVVPTVNAQGIIIMTIEQNISSVSSAGGIEGTPAIFERTISTEVVAADGQSVLLGGLISENKSTSASHIPFLGELPIIGHLFRKDLEESDKTELVVLVTPKIVKSTQDWEQIKQNFINELENLNF